MLKRVDLLLALFIGIMLISVMSFISVYALANQPHTKEFNITAQRFYYSPSTITVNQGDTVIIHLKSNDVEHGFYIDGYNIERVIVPGETVTLTFVANQAGKFTFRCSVTCGNFHPYMIGELDVQPNYLFFISVILAGLSAIGMIGAVYISSKKMVPANQI